MSYCGECVLQRATFADVHVDVAACNRRDVVLSRHRFELFATRGIITGAVEFDGEPEFLAENFLQPLDVRIVLRVVRNPNRKKRGGELRVIFLQRNV